MEHLAFSLFFPCQKNQAGMQLTTGNKLQCDSLKLLSVMPHNH